MTNENKTDENKTDKTGFEPDTTPIRIGAGWVVDHLRWVYQDKGRAAVIKEARLCGFDPQLLPDAKVLAVARQEATLRGYSPPGFSYHGDPCATCKGKGDLPDESTPRRSVSCPTCEGDGFAPAVADMDYRKAGDR